MQVWSAFLFVSTASAFSLWKTVFRRGSERAVADPICLLPGDPSLTLITNVDIGDKKSELLKGLSDAIVASTGKPESYVAVAVLDNSSMMWGGSSEVPMALCTFNSLGAVNLENNGKLQASITSLLEPFGVVPTKIYTTFNDIARENMGYDGKTFAG